jgi:hypothetical protein
MPDTVTRAPEEGAVMTLHASSVTDPQPVAVEVPRALPAHAVAASMAELMALPGNVAWALRDEDSSAFLDDRKPIGEQVEPGARISVTPKTHLG